MLSSFAKKKKNSYCKLWDAFINIEQSNEKQEAQSIAFISKNRLDLTLRQSKLLKRR